MKCPGAAKVGGMKRLAAALLMLTAGVAASDWPQWGGPSRDFKSDARGLADAWPSGGPKKLWSRQLGDGYSAISAADGQLFTMLRRGEEDVVVALNAKTGKTVWEFAYAAPFGDWKHLPYGPGPHAAPLVDGDYVFSAGATGIFSALERKTGKKVWGYDLLADFGGYARPTGFSCSPLAYKDTVIMLVGGANAAVVAFNKRDGKVVWKKHSFKTGSSSPILIRFEGQEQLVAFMYGEIVGLNPANGELLWSHPHETYIGLNISTPVWGDDNLLFFTSSYGTGSKVIRLKRAGTKIETEEVWASPLVRVHFSNAMRIGDVIYASSGDHGPAPFTAIDVKSGEVRWRNRELARASFVLADGKLIAVEEDGDVALLRVTPKEITVLAKAKLLDSIAWTAPTVVDTTLYIRDRKQIAAFDLK